MYQNSISCTANTDANANSLIRATVQKTVIVRLRYDNQERYIKIIVKQKNKFPEAQIHQ